MSVRVPADQLICSQAYPKFDDYACFTKCYQTFENQYFLCTMLSWRQARRHDVRCCIGLGSLRYCKRQIDYRVSAMDFQLLKHIYWTLLMHVGSLACQVRKLMMTIATAGPAIFMLLLYFSSIRWYTPNSAEQMRVECFFHYCRWYPTTNEIDTFEWMEIAFHLNS